MTPGAYVAGVLGFRSGRAGLALAVGGLVLAVLGRLPGMEVLHALGLAGIVAGWPLLGWAVLQHRMRADARGEER